MPKKARQGLKVQTTRRRYRNSHVGLAAVVDPGSLQRGYLKDFIETFGEYARRGRAAGVLDAMLAEVDAKALDAAESTSDGDWEEKDDGDDDDDDGLGDDGGGLV